MLAVLEAPVPVVLDAGALAVVAASPARARARIVERARAGLVTVLTPHEGEFERIAARAAGGCVRPPRGRATRRRPRLGAVVVLKGPGTSWPRPAAPSSSTPRGPPTSARPGRATSSPASIGGAAGRRVGRRPPGRVRARTPPPRPRSGCTVAPGGSPARPAPIVATDDRRRGARRRGPVGPIRGRAREARRRRRRSRRHPSQPHPRAASCAGNAAVMAVVKADAYGHGMGPVARAARRAGCQWLGVALPSEALALRADGRRRAGSSRGCGRRAIPTSPPACAPASTCPCPARGPWTRSWRLPRRVGAPARVHVKVDTGLSRNGAPADQLPAIFERALAAMAEGVDRGRGDLVASGRRRRSRQRRPSMRQLERYLAAARGRATRSGSGPRLRHLSNSGGLWAFPDARFDLVRAGIAMYGLTPSPGLGTAADLGLAPAMSLVARLAHVKGVAAGHERVVRRHLDAPSTRPRSGWCRSATPTASRARRAARVERGGGRPVVPDRRHGSPWTSSSSTSVPTICPSGRRCVRVRPRAARRVDRGRVGGRARHDRVRDRHAHRARGCRASTSEEGA